MSIRSKLFLTNGAVVILLLASLTFVFENYSRGTILDKLKENNGRALSQFADNVDSLLKSYEQIADLLYMNDPLQETLQQQNSQSLSEQHNEYFDNVMPLLTSIRSSKPISKLILYSDNTAFQLGDIRPIAEMPELVELSACSSNEPQFGSFRSWSKEEANGKNVLRLTQRLNHQDPRACLFAAIDVDIGQLEEFFRIENAKSQYIISLPDGNVIFDNTIPGFYGGKVEDYWFFQGNRNVEPEGDRVVRTDNREYLLASRILHSRNSVDGMRIISLTPLNELMEGTREIRSTALLLFLGALVLFVIANYMISSRLTRRLIELSVIMRKTDMDNLQTIKHIKGRDEVSQLSSMFNDMVQRMQRLILEVYEHELGRKEMELRTKESELYALQTQVNPHYLFNTLNAIRGNLLEKGDQENADIVTLLAKSFRNVLGKSGRMLTVAEELDIVETYLKIQAFRFSDRLRYVIDVPRPLHRMKLPKLSLQTIVENAIVHGLEPSDKETTIAIRAELYDEGRFGLLVEDDGPGITGDRLAAIRERLQSAEQPDDSLHIGMRNVHQRLRQSFGAEYGLVLTSVEGEGTTIVLNLPLEIEE